MKVVGIVTLAIVLSAEERTYFIYIASYQFLVAETVMDMDADAVFENVDLDAVNNNIGHNQKAAERVKRKYSRSELKALICSPVKAGTKDVSKIYCEVCCAKFPTKWSLQKHTKMKHAETMFTCSQCTKSFLFQSNLEKHIEEIHADADVKAQRTDGNIVIAIRKKKIVTKNPCGSEASKRKKRNKCEDNCVSIDNNTRFDTIKKAWIDFIDNNDYVVS